MAAASAGAVQQAAVAVSVASGTVDQQVVVNGLQQHQQQQQQTIAQNHQHQHQQQQHILHHHQQQRQLLHQQHQQQIRPQHHSVQYQSIPQQVTALPHQQRHPFIPRVGNGSQPMRHASIAGVVSGVNATAEPQQQQQLQQHQQQAAIITNHQQQHALAQNIAKQQQQTNQMLQQVNQQQQHQPQQQQQQQPSPPTTVAANLAPGWRRLFSNNEIVYVSPSGATLRSHSQIKDYLLSPNTCKCGLPCPLRPEYFFDFNSQVPTMLLQIPLENGLPARSSPLVCSHQRKYFEYQQQNIIHKEIKRRKITDLSTLSTSGNGKISTSPVPQCNSVSVYSGNVMQTSQLVPNPPSVNNSRLQMFGTQQPGQISSITYQQQQPPQQSAKQESDNEKQIGGVALSKTPPWRKNSILQQQNQTNQSTSLQQQQQQQQHHQIYGANAERIPPLPQSHLQQSSQNITPPWQQQQQAELIQSRIAKSRQSPSATAASSNKKKPNFKDDPTGYLDQQTAILHNSILNVVSSPDLSGATPPASAALSEENYNPDEEESVDEVILPVRTEQQQSSNTVIQQNQNVYPRNSLHGNIESKHQTNLGIKSQPQNHLQTGVVSNFVYQQNQPRMIARSRIGDKHQLQHLQSQQGLSPASQQAIQQQTFSQTQHILTSNNVPSSQHQQHYLVDKHQANQNPNHTAHLIRNAHFLSETDQQQATTTTIGGQTVTHFPNGMVQVEQNCDSNNIIMPLKPQQQVQLQQQIQQHNMLYRQSQQIQKVGGRSSSSSSSPGAFVSLAPTCYTNSSSSTLKVGVSHESPVSSSTTFSQTSSDSARGTRDPKGPAQVGAISTSNESPITCPSPADSESTSSTIKSSPSPVSRSSSRNQQGNSYGTCQTTGRNTITSVQAGRTLTATTTSTAAEKNSLQVGLGSDSQSSHVREIQYQSQKLSPNHLIPVSTALSGIQLQPAMREPGNQLIMTSTCQLIVMPVPAQASKSATNQVLISSPNNSSMMHQQSMAVINQQGSVVNSVDVTNSANHIIQNSHNSLVIQNPTTGLVQPSTNMIQSAGGNLISQNGQNFIVNSTGNGMQPVLLNNSNLIQQNSQNLNLIQTGPGGTKVIPNGANILNQSGNLISPNNNGLIGQQTVVLNTLPNGYVIQPNFTTVDGQMVSQIVNQDGGTSTFLQQQQTRQIILTSPDVKRKAKKRKSSSSSSPSTPSSLSPQQSPNMQQQQTSMVQLAPQYQPQGFQISPGIQGIAVMKKNTQPTAPQQQIIFQNGQILQPMNIIGQQLLVPAGLVVAPDTTLLQIQNIGACGNIITPQGMVLRASSPQNKNFLSPNGPTGQQFIVSGNNQMSPLGQIYGAPVSLVVPQSNPAGTTTTFVQQNTAIVQHQQATPTTMGGAGGGGVTSNGASSTSSGQTHHDQAQSQGTASPPDTTTHSPRSPERPPSQRSGGSDMVQCVSSSEPDSVVSPVAADSAQSPSTTDYDRSSNHSYQSNNTNMYKPSDAKIRRVDTPPQFNSTTTTTTIIHESPNQMPPDSHESPSNSPTASSASSTSSLSSVTLRTTSTPGNITLNTNHGNIIGGFSITPPSFSVGQLVWGAARGHPAWPGKIVSPPDGACTPSDSTWVQWFGGRSNSELVGILSLKTLSEGLEAHHKAQKDTRKSRKLNQQLERAIQEAMSELDRISAMAQPTSTTQNLSTSPPGKSKSRGRQPNAATSMIGHQRTKPIKIAPAPPCTNSIQRQQQQHRQQSTVSQNHQLQNPQSQSHQQQHPQSATNTSK